MAVIGPRIKERRLALGLSLSDVGKACDVAKSTIMHWEEGTDVRGNKLLRLAVALQTTVDYLLGNTDDPEASPVMTKLEQDLYRKESEDDLFDRLVEAAGLMQVVTQNADRVIISDGCLLKVDDEVIDRIMTTTCDLFAFLIKRESQKA